MTPPRETILNALEDFARQRPGLDPHNYDRAGYRADSRAITQQFHDAMELLNAVRRRSIDETQLREAFNAFSGRLQLVEKAGVLQGLDYCTGQYFPTEYRAAVCAVLRSALWGYWRSDVPSDVEDKRTVILRQAKLAVSRGVFNRWFRGA